MKIFYQSISNPKELLEQQSNSVEELCLPVSILQEFASTLKQSTELLPLSARDFKEWSVGLLDRYQRESAALSNFDSQLEELFK